MHEEFNEGNLRPGPSIADVHNLIQRCEGVSRQWIEGKLTRRDINALCGEIGASISCIQERGLADQQSKSISSQKDTKILIAKLKEVRETLRYARYAAVALEASTSVPDTKAMRQSLFDREAASGAGGDFPEFNSY